MRPLRSPALVVAVTLSATGAAVEQPLDRGVQERLEVNLAIVDVQVLDRKGSAVRDLAAEDFELTVDHRVRPIVSFDASCGGPSESPALVLAFDYQHLDEIQRGMALEAARHLVEAGGITGGPIMVAALTGGLRVEQSFTSEGDRIPAALRKMQYDVSLFAGNFRHLNEDGFVRGMTALFDVAATVPQPKVVLFYSAMRDVPLDGQFQALAGLASAARAVVYPIDVRGLDVGSPAGPVAIRTAVAQPETIGTAVARDAKELEKARKEDQLGRRAAAAGSVVERMSTPSG